MHNLRRKKRERITEECGENLKKAKELLSRMTIPKYIGETSRSAYERGFEHLDQLASLNKKSVMLKHILFNHEGSEFSDIKWGMFILKYQRSAFERQINEAVKIEKE